MGQSTLYGQKSLSLLKWFKKIRAQLSFCLLFKLKNRVISLSLSPLSIATRSSDLFRVVKQLKVDCKQDFFRGFAVICLESRGCQIDFLQGTFFFFFWFGTYFRNKKSGRIWLGKWGIRSSTTKKKKKKKKKKEEEPRKRLGLNLLMLSSGSLRGAAGSSAPVGSVVPDGGDGGARFPLLALVVVVVAF
jgi:hypothetical protein